MSGCYICGTEQFTRGEARLPNGEWVCSAKCEKIGLEQIAGIIQWDSRFMRLAQEACSWTKGLGAGVDRGVGACVVSPDRHQFSLGYAGFPRGVADTPERLASAEFRSYHTVHAELNAILNARCSVAGWTIYVTECPCADCANAIIQSGITRVVSGAPRRDSSWHRSQLEGAETMREAGLIVDRTTLQRSGVLVYGGPAT